MSEGVLIGAGVISAVNLGLGYVCGRKLTEAKPIRDANRIYELGESTWTQIDDHNRRVDAVNRRIGADSSVVSLAEREIREAISELLSANQKLLADLNQTKDELRSIVLSSRQLSVSTSIPAKPNSDPQTQSDQRSQPSVHRPVLSPGTSLIDVETVASYEPPRLTPRPYRLVQHIASYDTGQIPTTEDFQLVQCWDIASDGFSFLSPQPPRFRTLIVALGDSNFTYFSARISRVSAFNERGFDEFQVSCQFTGRMHNHLFE